MGFLTKSPTIYSGIKIVHLVIKLLPTSFLYITFIYEEYNLYTENRLNI